MLCLGASSNSYVTLYNHTSHLALSNSRPTIIYYRVGSFGHFTFKSTNHSIKSEIRELFGCFFVQFWGLAQGGPRRAVSLAISPSLGSSPSVYAQSTQSDYIKSCSKKDYDRKVGIPTSGGSWDPGNDSETKKQNFVRLWSRWPTSLPEKSVAWYFPKCPFLSLRDAAFLKELNVLFRGHKFDVCEYL